MAVYSYLDLSRELATGPLQKEYMGRQEQAINAMRDQIAFTREYQQLGAEAPLWQLVDLSVRSAKVHVDFRNVTLAAGNGTLEIFADPMLEKVFYNLFDNALRYGGSAITSITVS